MKLLSRSTSLVALGLLALAPTANAELIYGITGATAGANLVRFDSATPGTVTTIGALSGVVAGQGVRAIDFRPADGMLYAVSNNGTAAQLYTVNLLTGGLTAVGSGFTITGNTSTRVSIDFNPVVDRLRVITGTDQNLRVNPNNGALVMQDTNLSPADLFADVAYNNNVVGATQTTLYAYDYSADTIGTIGSVNGTPNSPNGGVYTSIGGVGLVSVGAGIGFDISSSTGVGYVSLDDSASPTAATEFYTANLGTGALTFVGNNPVQLLDISAFLTTPVAAVPEPGSIALIGGLGVSGLGLLIRRKRNR